jgi:hypothetical protein
MDDPGSCTATNISHVRSVSTLEQLHTPFRPFR